MDMTPKTMRNEKLGAKVVKALESRHFGAYYCATKEEGLKKALELIPEGSTVAWGGCMTAQQIGLMDAIQAARDFCSASFCASTVNSPAFLSAST